MYSDPSGRAKVLNAQDPTTRTKYLREVLGNSESFTKQGAHIEAMRVIGGGARGRFWNRIMADVYGMPVQRLTILEEATSMGAAVAGGVGVGLYKDFSISEQMNQIAEVVQPDPAAQQVYAKIVPIFEACYQQLLPIYDMIAEAGEKG